MKKQVGLFVGLIVLLGIGYGVVHAAQGQTKVPKVVAGSKATNTSLELTAVNGQTIAVNPNEKTVLHFMTSSCGDCIGTEESLTKFAHTADVQIISVDAEPQVDNLSTIQAFKKATGATWDYVLLKNPALINEFHVTELDTVVILYHGKVIYNGIAPSTSTLKRVLV